MLRSEPETTASRVEECPGYKTAIQRQPGINAKSAINQVLNTPEILAMILAEMDMRTLLISAQRVYRSWLNLISESPSIQKALFFTPIKESEWGMEEKTPNPLLAESFPSFFPVKGRPMYYQFNFSDLTMTKDASTMARFVRDDASWRRMLVQQPPISDIGVLHICHTMSGDYAGSSNIPAEKKTQTSGDDGLRMERLFELLLFSSQVQFFSYTKTRVYWSTETPISFDESHQNINDEFQRVISKFGLVFFTGKVVQCSGGMDDSQSSEELVREDIITAYSERGLDIDRKRKDIEESGGEVIAFQSLFASTYTPQGPYTPTVPSTYTPQSPYTPSVDSTYAPRSPYIPSGSF